MAEYIKREDVAQILDNAQMISNGEYSGYCTEDIDLNSIPAADVALVRHGRWVGYLLGRLHEGEYPNLESADYLECSACGENYYRRVMDFIGGVHNSRPSYDNPGLIPGYCPNCGAKMDKED